MLVVTTDQLPGYEVREVLGQVIGVTGRTRNPFKEGVRKLDGGPTPKLIESLASYRVDAIQHMIEQAARRGANAVIGMRFDNRNVSDMWGEICAYGTAVTVAPVATPRSPAPTSAPITAAGPTPAGLAAAGATDAIPAASTPDAEAGPPDDQDPPDPDGQGPGGKGKGGPEKDGPEGEKGPGGRKPDDTVPNPLLPKGSGATPPASPASRAGRALGWLGSLGNGQEK